MRPLHSVALYKMTVKEIKLMLSEHPDDMEVVLRVGGNTVMPFNPDHFHLTSKTAYVDRDAPEDEWNTEDGKIELGDGARYLLINPIIQ